jgi:hypothetical protein
MIAAFDDYRRIVRVAAIQRDPRSLKFMGVLAALFGLGLAAGTLFAVWQHTLNLVVLARATVGLAGFWLAIVWITCYMPGSILMNSASNARLLPRQRRRLLEMAAAAWLIGALVAAVALGTWAVVPLAGLYLIGAPLMMAGQRKAVVLVFVAGAWPSLFTQGLPSAWVAFITSPAGLWVATALVAAIGARGLRTLYPAGGDAHLDQHGEQVKRIERYASRGASGMNNVHDVHDVGGVTGWSIRRAYAFALRRDCRRAEPGAMLMHALGPVVHWSAWIGALGMALLIAAGVHVLLALNTDGGLHANIDAAASAASGVMAMLVLFSTAQYGQQMRRTRGEQSLLRLTPLAGDMALLNRRLAGQLLRRWFLVWLAQAAVILLVTLLLGGDGAALLRQFALCCLAGQVAAMGLLDDYAGEGGWNLMRALRAAVVAAIEVAVAVGLGWLTGPSVWPWLILIALVGAVLQLRYSWRVMLAAPVAFPAGRLA